MTVELAYFILGLAGACITALCIGIWYFVRSEREAVLKKLGEQEAVSDKRDEEQTRRYEGLSREMHALRELISGNYVKRDEFAVLRQWLEGRLDILQDRIDGKHNAMRGL